MASTSGEGTGSLEKALDVLDAVGAAPTGLSQLELADRLNLPRTTVYRLLATLVARGLLRRDLLRRVYCLGFRCFEMARQAWAMPDLVAAASVELRSLRDLTGETAYLATLDGLEVVSLERVDGAHSQRSSAALGQRKPLYCTSQGKAMLSAMPQAQRDGLIKDLALKPLTPLTITDRRRLLIELRITASRGYALDDEEIVLGVRCVGAPVVDAKGQVRGAISVAGPAWRMTRQRLDLLGPEVAEAARRIGAQLAVRNPVDSQNASGAELVQTVEGPWAFHGACPVWCPITGKLYWADTLAPAIRVCGGEFQGQFDRELAVMDSPVKGLALFPDRLLVAHAQGWSWLSLDGGLTVCQDWPALPVCALTEAPDVHGTVWAAVSDAEYGGCRVGVLSVEGRTAGRFEERWRTPEILSGLSWQPDGQALVATAAQTGAVLRFQPGQAMVRRLASVPRGSGQPSGLVVDAQGGVWLALTGGWSVMRLAPDGSVDRVIGLPVPNPTDVALGGPDGLTLFITTDRQAVAMDTLASAPLSGRLLQTRI
jgi:IclR family transcriptional regulator, acetate operon repressor